MGTLLALQNPAVVRRLVLLAPALNFPEYRVPEQKIPTEALVIIGKHDDVTPPAVVVPAAEATFANLQLDIVEDDHLLHNTYQTLDWDSLLQ